MKVVAFNGSPRAGGNTEMMIKTLFDLLKTRGIECELVSIGGGALRGCTACLQCRKNLDRRCVLEGDDVNLWIEKMIEADGIIIGSPTYFASLTPETKALIDRAGYVCRGNGNLLKRKVGAAVVTARRAGFLNVFQAINNFYLINEMVIPGSTYWNLSVAKAPGDFHKDDEGIETMRNLGENMAWLLERVESAP